MPWDIDNLPDSVKYKKWGKHQKKVFIGAANAALEKYKDDGKAIAIGIHAADSLNNSIITQEASCHKVPFLEPGLVYYRDKGLFLLTKETMDRLAPKLKGKPIVIQHDGNYPNVPLCDIHGYVSNVTYNDNDGQYYAEFTVHTEEGKKAVKELKYGSCGYSAKFNDKGGNYHNICYNNEIVDGDFYHLALTDKPRYEKAKILNNSKENYMTAPDEKNLIEQVKELLLNSLPPKKVEAKDEYVVKTGDKEYSVSEIKKLLNSMEKSKEDEELSKKKLENAKELYNSATANKSSKKYRKAKKLLIKNGLIKEEDPDSLDKPKEKPKLNNKSDEKNLYYYLGLGNKKPEQKEKTTQERFDALNNAKNNTETPKGVILKQREFLSLEERCALFAKTEKESFQ
jgi:hypothetical protein